jgi:hypothetical protein
MQVRLSEIALAARHRLAPLTAEVAGYIVWLVTAEALAQARSVSAERIGVTAVGDVTLAAGEPAPPIDIERELRSLLGSLLGLCQASTPALKKASDRPALGDLEALQGEIAAALIPINHAASRRALARLYRETDRARAELVVPVVIVEDGPDALVEGAPARVSDAQPSPALDLGLEPGWETPMSAVLQQGNTELMARSAPAPEVEISDAALVFEPETRSSAPVRDEPPSWIESLGSGEPLEDFDPSLLDSDGSAAASGGSNTMLRAARDADVLEIDVQFARDTERPAPGWPSEWCSETPAHGAVEPSATLDSSDAGSSSGDRELDDAAVLAAETPPVASHRRTQPGLAPLSWLPEIAAPALADTGRQEQTLRVTEPAPSGVADRHRSDLGQLLSRYLSESGSDERITKDLRRAMRLELEAERLSDDAPKRAVGS